MTLDRQDRALIGVNVGGTVACCALLVAFCLAGVRPLLARAAAATTTRHRLAAALQQRDTADEAARDGARQLQQLSRDTVATALVLLPPSRVNDVLARVAAVSAACGVQLDDVRVGKLTSGERYATLPVHAVGRGAYRDCVRFLHQINHDCPDVGVAAFGLVSPGGSDVGPVNVELDLRWHAALPTTPAR